MVPSPLYKNPTAVKNKYSHDILGYYSMPQSEYPTPEEREVPLSVGGICRDAKDMAVLAGGNCRNAKDQKAGHQLTLLFRLRGLHQTEKLGEALCA